MPIKIKRKNGEVTRYKNCRLSRDDGVEGESNSIGTQELICKGWFLPPNTYMTAAHLW